MEEELWVRGDLIKMRREEREVSRLENQHLSFMTMIIVIMTTLLSSYGGSEQFCQILSRIFKISKSLN